MVRFAAHKGSMDLTLAKEYSHSSACIVRNFHRTFPEYSETPLVRLPALASELHIKALYVKDESRRFGLNAFKVLGGSYAIGNYISSLLGIDISSLTFFDMTSPDAAAALGEKTFITATDGNHGRGVAWTANRLGQKSVVYMPRGTARERLDNILLLGSDASITDLSYDDAVRKAAQDAEKHGWILIQDTSAKGYEAVPQHIMQGYTTMALEAVEQLKEDIPTHVFLQAGVGSMAGAVSAFLADYYKEKKPVITIVEPLSADCLYQTAAANDGLLHSVTEEMGTIMAGLACGEPCREAWDLLNQYADFYVAVPDSFAASGMTRLAHPLGKDQIIISGESGAAGIGTLIELLTHSPEYSDIIRRLGLDSESTVLCISTEGATDRANYEHITGLSPENLMKK
ncbi:MAG: diaminopropionate ammonia-lyase [Eubacteriales bacterium]|nr:diaminopropionate ammonia-lyase [Eubacteriales bacterium]